MVGPWRGRYEKDVGGQRDANYEEPVDVIKEGTQEEAGHQAQHGPPGEDGGHLLGGGVSQHLQVQHGGADHPQVQSLCGIRLP